MSNGLSKGKGRTRRNLAPVRDSVSVKLRLGVTPDLPVYYVNYVEVGHTPHEFSLTFARAPSKVTPEVLAQVKAKGELILAAEMQILLPPTVIAPLITALRKQVERYETERKEKEGPK